MKTTSLLRHISVAAFAAAILAFSSSVHAQSLNWLGGNGTNASWGAAGNFNGTFVSSNTTDLTFDNVTRATTNSWGGNRTVRSITFGDNIDVTWTTATTNATVLTFSAASGNASLNILSGATGNITFGPVGAEVTGSQSLTSNLDINHNGSGLLSWQRQVSGAGGITKLGSGTMQMSAPNANSFTGPVNVNAGRLIAANTASATGDFGTASAVNLGGGTLEIRTTSALNKSVTANTTVSAASTLVYNNTTNTSQTLALSTGTMALSANLTVQNISSNTTLANNINISRNVTGAGSMIVDNYTSVTNGDSDLTLGRVNLSGNNTGWSEIGRAHV